MRNRILTAAFTVFGGFVGYGIYLVFMHFAEATGNGVFNLTPLESLLLGLISAIIIGFIFNCIAPAFIRGSSSLANKIGANITESEDGSLLPGITGVIFGLVIAFLLTRIYKDIITGQLYMIVTIILYVVLGFFGGIIGGRSGAEILSNSIAKIQPPKKEKPTQDESEFAYNEKEKKNRRVPKILDTSAIIDGRILEIMRTGFLEGPIVIPEFVLGELRHIADSSDSLKRTKGRRGLDVLNKIQEEYGVEIYNTDSEKAIKEIPEVDVKLLKLAEIKKGKVVTNDYNLNKVAAIKEITVLNVNELANAMKPIVIPGETMVVELIKQGKDQSQAIGYLDDGTMIVVENGRKLIGTTVEIVVTSMLQTAAGRMIFGRAIV